MTASKTGDVAKESEKAPESKVEAEKASDKLQEQATKSTGEHEKPAETRDSSKEHLPEIKLDGAEKTADKPAQAKIATDEKGQITRVEAANGSVREFGRGPDGQIKEVKD